MRFLLLFVLFSIVFGKSSVLSLSKSNYEAILNKGKVFVKYFSPKCGHCKAVAPTYEQLAHQFEKFSGKVIIAEVDCLANSAICKSAGVEGWPTFHFYKSGRNDYDEYDGDRNIEDFSQYLSSRIGVYYKQPEVKTVILTPENFDSIVYDPKLNVLVAFTASWCGHCKQFKPQLEIAAQSFRPSDNVVFGNIDADVFKDFTEKFGIEGYPTVKYFPAAQLGEVVVEEKVKVGKLYKGNQPVEPYNAGHAAADIIHFINARAGTFRLAGGNIQESAGIISSLQAQIKNLTTSLLLSSADASATSSASTSATSTAAQKAAVVEAVNHTVKNEYVAQQYVRYIDRIVDAGMAGLGFARTEHTRLTAILGKSRISEELRWQLAVRKNILSLFLFPPEGNKNKSGSKESGSEGSGSGAGGSKGTGTGAAIGGTGTGTGTGTVVPSASVSASPGTSGGSATAATTSSASTGVSTGGSSSKDTGMCMAGQQQKTESCS